MNWDQIDWSVLERLRNRFLGQAAIDGPYWETTEDLACYDFTYGERIGWKWDQVLRELRLRNWQPSSPHVLDWGCGSGVAARRVIEFFGAARFQSLIVWDHSPLACDFAAESAARSFPDIRVSQATPGFLASEQPLGLLVLSHVLNELTPAALADLRNLARRAEAVLWVEPGTHAISRQLGGLREDLRASFHLVAPCTQTGACPALDEGNEREWCHFFAPPPVEVFADSNWVKFGQRAGIDLRSLPYCFLALDRRTPSSLPAGFSRVLGRVETFKPYARLLSCDASGLATLELPRRSDPSLFKQLERAKTPLLCRWQRTAGKITSGELLAPPPSA